MKLSILLRLEPGCMGPKGADFIDEFCDKENLQAWQNEYSELSLTPRYDKTLPEWEYRLKGKLLSTAHIDKFLKLNEIRKSELEEDIEEYVAQQIGDYMKGKL